MVCSDGITDVISADVLLETCRKLLFDQNGLDANLKELLAGNVDRYKANLNIPQCIVPEILVSDSMSAEQRAATVLCQLAYFNGAEDNCSIVVFRV